MKHLKALFVSASFSCQSHNPPVYAMPAVTQARVCAVQSPTLCDQDKSAVCMSGVACMAAVCYVRINSALPDSRLRCLADSAE